MDESLKQVILTIHNDRQLICKMVGYDRYLRSTGLSKQQSARRTLMQFNYIESD